MADRTVRVEYSVDTAAEGKAQVEALRKEIEQLGGSGEKTAKEVDGLVESLKKQEAAQSAIAAFKTLEAGVEQLQTRYDTAKEKSDQLSARVKALADQLASAGSVTDREAAQLQTLSARQEAAQRTTDRLAGALQAKKSALETVSQSLQKSGVDTGNLSNEQAKLDGELKVTQNQLNEQIGSLVKLRNELNGTTEKTSSFGASLVKLAGGLFTLDALKRGLTAILESGAKFQTLERQLLGVFGSAAVGSDVLAKLKTLAQDSGQSLGSMSDAAIKLKRVGLDPLDGSLQAIVDQNAKLGGSSETLAQTVDILTKAYSKQSLGTREANELLALGVPVFDSLSKATGISSERLQLLAEKGLLGRDAVRALITEIGKQNLGEAARATDDYAHSVGDLKDRFDDLLATAANSGPLQFLSGQLKSATKDTKDLDDAARGLGGALTVTLAILATGANGIRSSWNLLTAAIRFNLSLVLESIALLESGLSKVTFGNLSKQFKADAEEIKAIAAGLRDDAKEDIEDIGKAGESIKTGVTAALEHAGQAATEAGAKMQGAAGAAKQLGTDGAEAAKTVATALEGGPTVAAKALIEQFETATKQGTAAADAAKKLIDAADLASADGINDLVQAIDQIAKVSPEAGRALQVELVDRLSKLSNEDLAKFESASRTAFEQFKISASELGNLVDVALSARLKRLNLDFQELRGGMSRTAIDLIANFNAIAASADSTGKIILASFTATLDKLSTPSEVEGLKVSLQQAFNAGKISAQQFAAGVGEAKLKMDELKATADPTRQALEIAFKTLGVTSQQSLNEAAQAAIDAFTLISSSGIATAGDINLAFAAMAEKILAAAAASGQFELANAEAMLRAKETTAEQGAALDELIKKYEKAGEAATTAGDKAVKASKDATDATDRQSTVIVGGGGGLAATSFGSGSIGDPAQALRAQLEKIGPEAVDALDAALRSISEVQDVGVYYERLNSIIQGVAERFGIDLATGQLKPGAQTSIRGDGSNDVASRGGASGNTQNPFSRSTLPTSDRSSSTTNSTSSSSGAGASVIQVNLDSQVIFRLLVNDDNVRRILIPILQRYLALTQ